MTQSSDYATALIMQIVQITLVPSLTFKKKKKIKNSYSRKEEETTEILQVG